MKKVFLSGLLFIGMITGVYASSLEDTQFQQYVELTKKNADNPAGMTVTADSKYRTIYIALPISANKSSVTQDVKKSMREAMLQEMRKHDGDRKVIKDLKINMVYIFITSDKNIVSIPISFNDI